jgi:anthranilate phosphoribosyltransferase
MTALAQAIKKVATGPHLSRDLSIEEANLGMLEILSGKADPVRAAIFFIALRMKTETNDENLGILQALQTSTAQCQADVDNLLILSEPYNGYNRHCPVTAFLPAVLAASGLPAVSQGVKEMGPKFGVTHSQVLAEAGMNVDLSVQAATERVNNPDLGWAYIDQQHATPALYALEDLRTKMIKRPSLAALEKLIMPIKAKGRTHLQIGFVHKAYPNVLAWLAQQVGFHSALVIRGLEGGVLPTLRKPANCFRAWEDSVEQTTRGVLPELDQTVTAKNTVELGLDALSGKAGPAFDSLVYGAAMTLWHCGLQATPKQAADHVRQVIRSGQAKARFERGLK